MAQLVASADGFMATSPSTAFLLPTTNAKAPSATTVAPRQHSAPSAGAVPLGAPLAAVTALCAAAALAGRRRSQRAAAVVQVRAGPKVLEGTGGPFPEDFWDPAGLAKGKSDEQLLHWRAVEMKHGRVCMLACLGWFHVAAGWHPVGDAAARMRVSDDPLINVTQLPMGGAFQVVFTIMCFEWLTTYVCKPPAERPWDILGWSPILYPDNQDWRDAELREINNGRLAMMGFIGLVSQDLLTGDYFAGIGKPCFGNIVCKDIGTWDKPFPPTPFVMPELYPGSGGLL